MKRLHTVTIVFLALFILPSSANTQTAAPSDYLILQTIGGYHSSGKGKCGNGAGLLEATDHFGEDHSDITCKTGYYNTAQDLAVSIEVSQHTGGDSDKWLLHEAEDAYRKNPEQDNFRGTIREINRNKIFAYTKGTHYSWISNYVVVDIKYTDLQKTKPEPLEIIQAYIQKFPSNITLADAEAKSRAHNEKWIKDEMDRRLWLCDKWFAQLQLGTVQQKDAFQAAFESMNIFLGYREKYYGIKAEDDKNLLAGYLNTNNGTGIRERLAKFKTWWGTHKGDSITISFHK